MVESDLDQKKEAETHFKEAIKLAALTEKYDYVAKVCRRCSLYYQKYGHFDEALEMERKAYASQLMLNDQTGVRRLFFLLHWESLCDVLVTRAALEEE